MSHELRRRIVTAVFGAGAVLSLLIWCGHLGASLVAVAVSLGMVWEFVGMTLSLPDRTEKRAVLLGWVWLVSFANFFAPRSEFELFLISFLGLFTYFLLTASRHKEAAFAEHFRELMFSVFGMIYLGFLPLYLPLLRSSENGLGWTLLFLCVVWAGDIGAYFFGRRYGRRKLYPVISPNKTVEGALGGVGSAIFVALSFRIAGFRAISWGLALFLPIILVVVSQVGDLCESFLKRAFHQKDSGSLLPGHGGFLDRFDGVIFALPVMYGCVRLFG